MASNLSRTIAAITRRITLSHPEPATRGFLNSVSNSLISSSATSDHTSSQPNEHKEESTKVKQERENDEVEVDDEEGGEYVNKETGEVGGPRGPEPTRFGDWEKGGRCSDF